MKYVFVLATLFLPVATAADAATIEVVPLKGKVFKSVITVTGKILVGDEKAFRAKLASAVRPAIVAFNSPGGNVAVAVNIGEQIKANGLPTYVPGAMTCSSACALAWLAGSTRYMRGRVGFHAAWEPGPEHAVSSVGNALQGAYYARLGLSYDTIKYLTEKSPTEMAWLNKEKAMELYIAFLDHDPTAVAEVGPAAPAIKPALLSCGGAVGLPPCAPSGEVKKVPGGEVKIEVKPMPSWPGTPVRVSVQDALDAQLEVARAHMAPVAAR